MWSSSMDEQKTLSCFARTRTSIVPRAVPLLPPLVRLMFRSEERRDSTAMTVDADSQHVLLPMQQGSPPRHRLGRSRGVVAVKVHARYVDLRFA